MSASLVGSEMCIRDSPGGHEDGCVGRVRRGGCRPGGAAGRESRSDCSRARRGTNFDRRNEGEIPWALV
eukprot:5344517-Alexandrium_andersonii.AAC.1